MRVAFDEQIFSVQRHGGISRVFAELARQFTSDDFPDVEIAPVAAPIVNEYVLHDASLVQALDVWPANAWQYPLTRNLLRRRWKTEVDILHNTFYLPRGLGDYPRGKRIVTVHDMIPEVFPKTRRRLDFLTRKHEYLQQADHIICVSEATKNDLLRIYNDIETPISVVYSGVSSDFTQGVARDTRLPERYILFVGNRSGYKDARTAIEAFARIAPEYPDLHLLMVGGGGLTRDELSLITSLGMRRRVQQRTVSDADMPTAYANAEMFVFPSRYEGFGLPALEAMASGTPAVLCQSSSLPEVGGDAAVYFELGNTDDLAKKMQTLLDEPSIRDHHIALGLQRSAVFSWRRTAQETLAVYAKALGASTNSGG